MPSAARMKENSPICARLTAIVRPVSNERPNTRTIASAASDLPTTMIASVASTGSGCAHEDRRIEQHADRDEEQHRERIAERQRLLGGLVAQLRIP